MWVATSVATKDLQVNRKTLYNLLWDQCITPGIHYRILNPKAKRVTYRWNVEAIKKYMSEPA
jgi:hypothetical protein